MNKLVAIFIGLNILDLILTGIGLSKGAIEANWYGWLGIDTIWEIVAYKIIALSIILLVLKYYHKLHLLKPASIAISLVCISNGVVIYLI